MVEKSFVMANRFNILPTTQEANLTGLDFGLTSQTSTPITPTSNVFKEAGNIARAGIETILPGPTERIRAVKKSIETRSFKPLGESFKKQIVEMVERSRTPEGIIEQALTFGPVSPIIKLNKVADTALSRLISTIKTAKPIRKEITALQSAERAKRAGAAGAILEKVPGEKGIIQAKAQLKGPLVEKPRFEPLRAEQIAPTISKDLQPLAQEARKYKSAEELIKNFDLTIKEKPTHLYRGIGGDNVQAQILVRGIHAADNPIIAAEFASRSFGLPNINVLELSPRAKIADLDKVKAFLAEKRLSESLSPDFENKLTKALKDAGYDGAVGTLGGGGKEYIIINQRMLKDTRVLREGVTDFYNQAVRGVTKLDITDNELKILAEPIRAELDLSLIHI